MGGIRGRLLLCMASAVFVVGCGQQPLRMSDRARGVDRNELVLELGSLQAPVLRDVLERQGVAVPRRQRPVAVVPVPAPVDPVPVDPGPVDQGPAVHDTPPVEEDPAEFAELKAGETLSNLCARVFGTSRVWPQVAQHNGWSERDLRRLPAGTRVELPPDLTAR